MQRSGRLAWVFEPAHAMHWVYSTATAFLVVSSEGDFLAWGDPEGGEPPGCFDYTLHYLSLPWKVLFAVIPPTILYGGKITFVIALIFIGLVTGEITAGVVFDACPPAPADTPMIASTPAASAFLA